MGVGFHPLGELTWNDPQTLLYPSENWTLTSKERQMLTTTEISCLRKAAGKNRMDKIRNEEIRRRTEQTANKIRWWYHVKRMAPTAPHGTALAIQPVGRQPRERPQHLWEDNIYNTISYIVRRIHTIVNISSFEVFINNKYNTTIIQIYTCI